MCFDMSYLIFSTIVVLISVTSTTHGAYREYTPVLITSLSSQKSKGDGKLLTAFHLWWRDKQNMLMEEILLTLKATKKSTIS